MNSPHLSLKNNAENIKFTHKTWKKNTQKYFQITTANGTELNNNVTFI